MVLEGYIKDLSDKDYHADFAISSSALVHALRSPAHFWANYIGNPARIEQKETDALRYGRAIHSYLLEPDKFVEKFITAPACDKRTKEGKATWADITQKAESIGATVITVDELHQITSMASALADYALCDDLGRKTSFSDIFSKGTAEESFFWEDPKTGLRLRARTDWRIGSVIIDYKTCLDAREQAFRSEIVKRRYYMRAAMYMDGVEIVTGKRPTDFYFVAQEKSAPFCPAAYRLDENDLLLGQRQYQDALLNIKACMTAGKWIGYPQIVKTLTVPAYVYEEAQ